MSLREELIIRRALGVRRLGTEAGGLLLNEEGGAFVLDDPAMMRGVRLTEYTLTRTRMGVPQLSAKLRCGRCLDDEWTGDEYVRAGGDVFFLRGRPSSRKVNTDERYEHDLEFAAEAEVLSGLYFFDVATVDAGVDYKPLSEGTDFSFYGTMREMIGRLNCALVYAGIGDSGIAGASAEDFAAGRVAPVGDGYCVVAGDGDWDMDVAREVRFEDKYLWEALGEAYGVYGVPFELRGRVIVFGARESVVDGPLGYGHERELLSVGRNSKGERIVNDITGRGSSENIPYYYPNDTEYGSVGIEVDPGNRVLTDARMLEVVRPDLLVDRVRMGASGERSVRVTLRYDETGLCPVDGMWMMTDSGYNEAWAEYVVGTEYELGREEYTDKHVRAVPVRVWFTPEKAGRYALEMRVWWMDDGAQPARYEESALVADGRVRVVRCVNAQGMPMHVEGWPSDEALPLREIVVEAEDDDVEGRCMMELTVEMPNAGTLHMTMLGMTMTCTGGDRWWWECGGKKWMSLERLGLRLPQGVEPSREMSGDGFYWAVCGRMPYAGALTVPKYRRTWGAERFYPAINEGWGEWEDAYRAEGGGMRVFENPWSPRRPSQYIYVNEDLKPGIDGVRNVEGMLFGEVVDVAFDADDNDLVKGSTGSGDERVTDVEEYEHSFFYLKLHRLDYVDEETGEDYSLDLFGMAAQEEAMTIQMLTGRTAGCKFKVQAVKGSGSSADRQLNPVQTDGHGDIVDGNVGEKVRKGNIQEWQQDTRAGEVWVAVQKDIETFGVIMPNAANGYRPQGRRVDAMTGDVVEGDRFSITGIRLPKCYVLAAERRLEAEMMDELERLNRQGWTMDVELSRVWCGENMDTAESIDEYSVVDVEWNGGVYRQYVQSVTWEWKDGEALPQIRVELSDEMGESQGFVDRVAEAIGVKAGTLGGGSSAQSGSGQSGSGLEVLAGEGSVEWVLPVLDGGQTVVRDVWKPSIDNVSPVWLLDTESGALVSANLDGGGRDWSRSLTLTGTGMYRVVGWGGPDYTYWSVVRHDTNTSSASASETVKPTPERPSGPDAPAVCTAPVITVSDGVAAITCATQGAAVRYTVDGSEPTSGSDVYSEPIVLGDECVIKAVAGMEGMADSAVTERAVGLDEIYRAVEWLRGTGSQYILVEDYVVNYTRSARVVYDLREIGWTEWQDGLGVNAYMQICSTSSSSIGIGNGRPSMAFAGGEVEVSFDAATRNETVRHNGSTIEYAWSSYTRDEPLCLFGLKQSGGGVHGSAMSLGETKAWMEGALAHDFVPVVRRRDGAAGMFDRVTRVLYTNMGSGAFAVGPDKD